MKERTDSVRPLALLVDDVPDVLRTTGIFLEAAGFEVALAKNGDEALVYLASGQTFALLVTDYAMPGLSGVDLFARALEKLPALKGIIITGFPDAENLAALPPGATLLLKPFRRAELFAQLKTIFGTGQTGLSDAND